ncbi:multidrug resistance protein D [Salmonella enterica subsp. enterica]|uniref:Multidrug resistance protein D n=1 Tax=Salmonella enterica I TaxID=59201 RepID=A0A379VHV1_SALET|nr:multidrug resistance protein D [Salmonella enterica subsp. enterica]
MLFPLATSGAMEPFPFLAGTAGALVGGLQNIGSGVLAWLSAMLPQTGQGSLGTVDDPYGIADPGVLAAAGVTDIASGTDGLTFPSPAFCRAFHTPARSSH